MRKFRNRLFCKEKPVVYITRQALEISDVDPARYEQKRSSCSHPRIPIGLISERAQGLSVCVTVDQTTAAMQIWCTRNKRLRRPGLMPFWQHAQMLNGWTNYESSTGSGAVKHQYVLWRNPSELIQCQGITRLLLASGSLFTNTSTIIFALCNH